MNLNKSIPIWRDANALLIAVENTVKHFPRYHKYTLGSEMRLKAMQICRLIAYAWQNKSRAPTVLPRLIDAVDDLKIQIQLAKELQALQNFAHFQQLTELAVSVGKQYWVIVIGRRRRTRTIITTRGASISTMATITTTIRITAVMFVSCVAERE